MKKVVILFYVVVLALSCSFVPPSARANEEKYSRILSDDVVLYMDSSMTLPWFTLPYSYYVKVLSASGNSAKVEYRGDNPTKPSAKGYVAVDALNIVDEVPPVVYPNITLTVNQNCLLYKDSDFTLTETATQNSSIDFYGVLTRPNGEKFVYGYVSATSGDKYVGYISINALSPFTIPSLIVAEETGGEEKKESMAEESEGEKQTSGLQLAIVIAVSAVALSIVYLLFKPSGGGAKEEAAASLDVNDY